MTLTGIAPRRAAAHDRRVIWFTLDGIERLTILLSAYFDATYEVASCRSNGRISHVLGYKRFSMNARENLKMSNPRRMTPLLFLPIAVALTGCASLSPYGKKWNGVYVTHNRSDVSACKYVDVFHSWPPYVLPNDDIRNISRRAAKAGANTVLIVGTRLVVTKGLAYECPKT